MLTPEQIGHSGDKIEKCVTECQDEIEAKLADFLEFMAKPNVTRADLHRAKKEFHAYVSKMISHLRKQTNKITLETIKELTARSLKSDRELIKRAAQAGAEMEARDG